MPRRLHPFAFRALQRLALSGLLCGTLVTCAPPAPPAPVVPWPQAADGWRADPIWFDGLAEKATYGASRLIYNARREYTAVAYTNKQRMDAATTTKASGDDGVLVFKHHWSERVPTERYDYDLSTCTFTACDDLSAFKLTAATQEDCGASFKQVWRDGAHLAWHDSVYHPDAGMRRGRIHGEGVQFVDALPLLLRDYPFDAPVELVTLTLLPSQKSTRQRGFAPVTHVVTYAGTEALDLPLGALDAHRLHVAEVDGDGWYDLWFAADGDAPWLHVLLAYADHEGTGYRLSALERTAYWERG